MKRTSILLALVVAASAQTIPPPREATDAEIAAGTARNVYVSPRGAATAGGFGGAGGGSGNVSSALTFSADNRLIRTDGTNRNIQVTGITVDDSNNVSGINELNVTSLNVTTSVSWGSTVMPGANGGTGVANTGKTITIGGNVEFSGAHAFTGTLTGTTTVTFPTSGTISTLAGTETLSNKTVSNSSSLDSNSTFTGNTLTGLNAGATISQFNAVYLGGSSTWLAADADGTNTYPARGLSIAAYVDTNAATVLVRGVVRNDSWTWTPGGTIYISTTAGALTQTAPSASGSKVQQVGFALTATVAYFDFASGEYLTNQ
jgi:hypothetical protein